MATETVSGSAAAKELDLALAQIYNYIRTGKVTNHKKDGWPIGKGIEVNLEEVRAAKAAIKTRAPRGSTPKASRQTKATSKAAIHEALDDEAEEKKAKRAAARAHDNGGNTVRLKRYERHTFYSCPVNPGHGSLVKLDNNNKKGAAERFYCSHQSHDGRARSHGAGFAPPTQNVFSEEELRLPQPVGQLGEIMLNWIANGRTDLSESLEAWMIKNKLEVWIPAR